MQRFAGGGALFVSNVSQESSLNDIIPGRTYDRHLEHLCGFSRLFQVLCIARFRPDPLLECKAQGSGHKSPFVYSSRSSGPTSRPFDKQTTMTGLCSRHHNLEVNGLLDQGTWLRADSYPLLEFYLLRLHDDIRVD